MKIRCDKCGHKNPEDAQLCEECGAPLNRKKRPIVKLVILFLALLLVDTALWFYFAHKPTQVRITVTSQNPEFGVVKGDSTYCQSDTITIVAIAKEGYRFVKWNDGNTDSVRTIVADGDKEYIAIFEACNGSVIEPVHETPDEEPVPPQTPPKVPQFKISVVSSNPDMGRVTGDGIYDSLASVTIEAIAYEGYRFESWNDGNKNATRAIKVTANQRFSANFSEQQPKVTPPSQTQNIEVDLNGVATYRGPGLGNQPDGIGKLSFYSDYQLDLKDINGTKLDIKAGEFVEGAKFVQGKLRQGTLHRKDGTTVWFNI